MHNQLMNNQVLENVPDSKSDEPRKSGFVSTLARMLNQIVESIMTTNEFKIYSFPSRSRHSGWVIHDRRLGYRFFDSEAEVRKWIERRYYE
jgi:hypothetical protein